MADGLHFKTLVEEVKRDLAINSLKQKDLSIGDVANLLGYADFSLLTRAFEKWFGKAPTAYQSHQF